MVATGAPARAPGGWRLALLGSVVVAACAAPAGAPEAASLIRPASRVVEASAIVGAGWPGERELEGLDAGELERLLVGGRLPAAPPPPPVELTTVADDEVVWHWPAAGGQAARVLALDGYGPGTWVASSAGCARTLARPPGSRLATVATVNDLHFGEERCGVVEGADVGPVLTALPGDDPYPQVMNEAAVAEISRHAPDLVVAKGDLTDAGRPQELAAFLRCYGDVFGDRLIWVRGNHDVAGPEPPRGPAMLARQVEGLLVALIDTSIPGRAGGSIAAEQLEWLDGVASTADRPVLVLGHHHPHAPGAPERAGGEFGLDPASSAALVALVGRRPAVVAYAAGHTHRNRVRRFRQTGDVPYIEVASVKDFPGSWAEYRVFEGGILQVHRRISSPGALGWSDRCRKLVSGWYPSYAFGRLEDRCFAIPLRGAPDPAARRTGTEPRQGRGSSPGRSSSSV